MLTEKRYNQKQTMIVKRDSNPAFLLKIKMELRTKSYVKINDGTKEFTHIRLDWLNRKIYS